MAPLLLSCIAPILTMVALKHKNVFGQNYRAKLTTYTRSAVYKFLTSQQWPLNCNKPIFH